MRLAKAVRQKVFKHVNEGFTEALQAAFKEKFGHELESSYNIFAMAMVSAPAHGEGFKPEEKEFCVAFEAGYVAAMTRCE